MPRAFRRAATTVLTLLAIVLVAAPQAGARLRFTPSCGGNFECARLKVPLDRTGRVPGTVRLSIERLRASGRRRGAVFALAGGPGQGASSVTEGFNTDVFGAIGRRDLIVVDQRGTGRSGALACRELEAPGEAPIDARTATCAGKLGARRSLYTTADSVEDLEAVRAELGIAKITLFGVSYGTKVALAYAQRYPARVERLVLDSVVEPAGADPFDRDALSAIPRVVDEMCRGECGRVTPSASRDVAALADRLGAAPLRGPLVDARGRTRTRTVTSRDLYQRIRAGDTISELRVDLPGVIRAALDGDSAPLVRAVHGGDDAAPAEPDPDEVRLQAQQLSFTLNAATLCEEAPLPWPRTATAEERDRAARERAAAIPDAAFEPFDRATVLAPDSNNLLFQCRRWPAAPVLRGVPPDSPLPDVPVLVLAGREDIRTPLEVGRRLAARIPRAQVVEVPKTGHSVLGSAPCARTALRRFFADRALGAPCRGRRRDQRIRPVPPSRLDAVMPARGIGGTPGRTVAAIVLTLRDLDRGVVFSGDLGGGLRGGTFRTRNDGMTVLRSFSYVPGVRLTGRLRGFDTDATGRLRVTGSAAARGTVTLRDGRITGRLGGRAVRIGSAR